MAVLQVLHVTHLAVAVKGIVELAEGQWRRDVRLRVDGLRLLLLLFLLLLILLLLFQRCNRR